jgi:hypothetical protein
MQSDQRTLSPEEEERKRAIFDSMSPRSRKRIEKIGYDNWDPFQEPKDPIDIRGDKQKRTTQMLVRQFLQTTESEKYGNAYSRGVLEICLGIINDDERYIGMFDFACWYQKLLEEDAKRGL